MEDKLTSLLQEATGNSAPSDGEISKLSHVPLRKMLINLWKMDLKSFSDQFSLNHQTFLDWLLGNDDAGCCEAVRKYLIEMTKKTDKSTAFSQLRGIFLAALNSKCYFINGGDFPDIATFAESIADKVSNHVFFVFVNKNAKASTLDSATRFPWFRYVRAVSDGKDATNHILSMAVALANEFIPLVAPFFIVSSDKSAANTAECATSWMSQRRCIVVQPKEFREHLLGIKAKKGSLSKAREAPEEKTTHSLSVVDRFNGYCWIIHKYERKRKKTRFAFLNWVICSINAH